jgi:hypothetical protein
LNDWLNLMLDEVRRKELERLEAAEEARRRGADPAVPAKEGATLARAFPGERSGSN